MFKMSLFICFFTVNLFSVNSASDLLKSVQAKYESLSDFSADFQKTTNGKTDLNGKFFFKKENKIRLELKNLTIVSDGETNWNHNKKENKVIITEYNDSDPYAFSINKVLFEYPSKCLISTEGENVLVFTPESNSGLKFNSVKITVGADDLVNKIVIDDPNSGLTEVKITGYKINQNLANSQFTLTPPEGSSIIDLR
jgi:outer membrane lipoprotein-sorting protein